MKNLYFYHMLPPYQTPILQQIKEAFLADKGVKLYLKREDIIHPIVSGNKWRKLKYNLLEAKKHKFNKVLTFGGAYSNHIFATAAAAKEAGLKSIGIIRGEEVLPLNDTLQFAKNEGMELYYMNRSKYRQKNEPWLANELEEQFDQFYLIPEGGTNALAIKGCMEIKDDINIPYDVICSPVGTGGTLAGLIASHHNDTNIIGFSALKENGFLSEEIKKLLIHYPNVTNKYWKINNEYHFGGYAKIKPKLIDFIHSFHLHNQIVLDPIYTGKMMFGLYNMISKDEFKDGTTIIALHTGGLQGISGIEQRHGIKLPK